MGLQLTTQDPPISVFRFDSTRPFSANKPKDIPYRPPPFSFDYASPTPSHAFSGGQRFRTIFFSFCRIL
ncbi:uncharacterized protein P884DRAFT_255435 [Thermothelomyces heterothallicus CBS 202.75]|uniref:uncharacterized protein n=1 Tax=Thermothelomyces heterothallicus CBS 202.75 TaxID=1149848 RepID=UPI0037441B98